ncbi:MAG: hypothetical protein HY843_00785 [Bdellovibrio sp.]|nr:hypothetical protein [Bdellovibrio sp.]
MLREYSFLFIVLCLFVGIYWLTQYVNESAKDVQMYMKTTNSKSQTGVKLSDTNTICIETSKYMELLRKNKGCYEVREEFRTPAGLILEPVEERGVTEQEGAL